MDRSNDSQARIGDNSTKTIASSARQEVNSNNIDSTIISKQKNLEGEAEISSTELLSTEKAQIVSADSIHENTGDSTFSLLDKESQSENSVNSIEKDKEYHDDSLTKPTLLVTEDNDNIISTQGEQESKEDSYVEDEEDLEHIESSEHQDDDDQELLFVQHEDNGDSDHMVSSIHTSDDTGSENSLNMRDDSSEMLVSPPDIRTPSSPSQNSEDNNSIESGDVNGSYVLPNSSNQNEYIERDIPVMPAPGETRSQILAPLDYNEDEEEDESRIQLTPILTTAVETDDDPPSPTLSEFSSSARVVDININNSNSNRSHLPHIPEILLRHQRHNVLDFRHRQDSSLGEFALNIFHHQILLPFFQGFSWGIGLHLYRYMRNGFSLRSFWRSLSGGVRGTSSNSI